MRYALILIAAAAFGQTNSSSVTLGGIISAGTITWGPPEPSLPKPGSRYMVIWTTSEPCHECSTRFAIVCSTLGCDAPRKEVAHTTYFETLAEAQKWLDGTRRVVGIYKIRPLEITVTEKQVEIPQPAQRETRYEVQIGKSQ